MAPPTSPFFSSWFALDAWARRGSTWGRGLAGVFRCGFLDVYLGIRQRPAFERASLGAFFFSVSQGTQHRRSRDSTTPLFVTLLARPLKSIPTVTSTKESSLQSAREFKICCNRLPEIPGADNQGPSTPRVSYVTPLLCAGLISQLPFLAPFG